VSAIAAKWRPLRGWWPLLLFSWVGAAASASMRQRGCASPVCAVAPSRRQHPSPGHQARRWRRRAGPRWPVGC